MKFTKGVFVSVGLSALLSLSCSSGSFSGNSPAAPAKKTESANPVKPTPTPISSTIPGEPGQQSSATPEENKPLFPPGTLTSIVNFLGGALQKIKDIDIDVGDLDIEFGRRKAFHIGDGNMDATSCKLNLDFHSVRGVKYFFEFSVLEDGTDIAISAGTLCGVDYNTSNFAYLLQGETTLQEIKIQGGQESLAFQDVRLNRGKYAILFESAANSGESEMSTNGDHDDYMVGNIKIKSLNGKKIEPGQVSFE